MERRLRSQPTRDRILQAAQAVFGEKGYDRATIRGIAAQAQIHPSMVIRYYGSKEGLFAAAVDLDLDIPDLGAVARKDLGRALVRHFVRQWESGSAQLPSLLRVSVTHEQARTRLAFVLQEELAPIFSTVVDEVRRKDCAALAATQILGLALTRHVIRLPAVRDLERELIIDEIGATIQAYIDGERGGAGKQAL